MNTDTKPLQIYPAMCKEQCDDIAHLLHALDEFGSTALALSGKSAQGYTLFIDARDQIRDLVKSTVTKYRLVSQ